MAIIELIAFMPPPVEPRDVEDDWNTVEAELSIQYPSDFRDLIKKCGTGEFFDGLLILNPLNSWWV